MSDTRGPPDISSFGLQNRREAGFPHLETNPIPENAPNYTDSEPYSSKGGHSSLSMKVGAMIDR